MFVLYSCCSLLSRGFFAFYTLFTLFEFIIFALMYIFSSCSGKYKEKAQKVEIDMEKESIREAYQKQTTEEAAAIAVTGLNNLKTSDCRPLRQKISGDIDFLKWTATLKKEHYDKTEIILCKIMPKLKAAYKLCNSELKRLAAMPSLEKMPRLYISALRFCTECSLDLSEGGLRIFFDTFSKKCSPSLSEYFSAKAMFYAALISLSKKLTLESNTVLLDKVSECLSIVSNCNFESMAEKSECADILAKDPSGAYPNMTEESRLLYLRLLCKTAKKHKSCDADYARSLLDMSKKAKNVKERHIGYIFYKRNGFVKKLYFFLLIGIPVTVIALLSIIISPLCLLALFPVWESIRLLLDFSFSLFLKPIPLPRMKIDKIPKDSAVLVVISSVLSGEENDNVLFEKLSQIYHSCGEDNIYLALLADIPDGKYAKAATDEKILSYAYGRIASLNKKYGNRFILLERRRSFSKTQDKFMGWERKRGAIIELVRLLKNKTTTFSSESQVLAREILGKSKIKYIVTLDKDTNIPIDAVKNMYACMEHPLHTPVICKKTGIVTEGYGIMQPRSVPDLVNSCKTPFTRLLCYSSESKQYSLDTSRNILGESIFHGKGIFNVDAFYNVIDENCTFPEDKILNHSTLEGAKLRCMLLSDIEFTDNLPEHELSYLSSLHRHIRGNIQNSLFLFGKIVFDKHDTRKNTISLLSKFKLFEKIISAFLPCFTFVCVYISAFSSPDIRSILLLLALSHYIIPAVLCLISYIRLRIKEKTALRFFSKGVIPVIPGSILYLLFSLSMLQACALCSFDAIVRSIFRMYISGKNLLEWQTIAPNDNSADSLLAFVHKNIFSFFSGFLLFVFADAGILRFLSLLWFAFPVIAYHTSKEDTKSKKKQSKYNPTFRKYARDIWKYFSDNVTEGDNFLPPDNIDIAKNEICHETSPTDIGLYLLSVLCARDFGFIDSTLMQEKISQTLDTLEKLPKWNGHLYNRYSTQTLKILPPYFISTVDSGNFTACLIILARGLREYVYESTELLTIIKRIETLDKNCDYSKLYNKDRNLFTIGASITKYENAEISKNCFELYMNKARTVSYIECARRNIPLRHWTSLSRVFTEEYGYTGLISFNGSASEYFMPQLFLPTFENSLGYEALSFALAQQKKQSVKHNGKALWGISDSQCSEKEENGNYKYSVFGLQKLALSEKATIKPVISPYSSFLTMCISPKSALENLENIRKLGAYGEYGFYEAIDFTKGTRIVSSYMTQHLGMSLAALCNAKFDNIICKRFASDSKMTAGIGLLREKIPTKARIKEKQI